MWPTFKSFSKYKHPPNLPKHGPKDLSEKWIFPSPIFSNFLFKSTENKNTLPSLSFDNLYELSQGIEE